MRYWHFFATLWLTFFASTVAQAKPDSNVVHVDHVEAQLVAENLSLQTGDVDNWVALRLKPDPGWHVYWRNPGDSGIPTAIEWTLPVGVTAGDMLWPYPHAESLGELTNYGYSDETLHLIPIRASSGDRVSLQANASWLVCKDVCIPGEASLSLKMPVSDASPATDPAWAEHFGKARQQIPAAAGDWNVEYSIEDGQLSLSFNDPALVGQGDLAFFPIANDLVSHAAPQFVAFDDAKTARMSQKLSTYFVEAPSPLTGVLVVKKENAAAQAFEVEAKPGKVAPVTAEAASAVAKDFDSAILSADTARPAEVASLLGAIGLAFIGGLILNLMPCVFPVLAMKALSVLGTRDESAARHRQHALVYTAGVISTFVVVASILIGLRAGGEALGWGFQLQSPAFVFVLTAVIFAMGLSLSGAVNFGVSWMGAGQSLASKPGLSGSFFTGVLAVVVASPCTAPFMAPALGFALAQPAAGALLIFVALGLGLALPFLLIGFFPVLAAALPKPGRWMETFKQLMAFPMYLTAVWLLWVLGGLSDRDGMAIALVGLVLVGAAIWQWSRASGGGGRIVAGILLAMALSVVLHPSMGGREMSGELPILEGREAYSDERFDALRSEGKSVFVDFTADWCLTCKVNEQGVLSSQRVKDIFQKQNVTVLIGDWTRADPKITAVLDRYGRSGVPLYLASKNGGEPSVLPQILTGDIIAQAFE